LPSVADHRHARLQVGAGIASGAFSIWYRRATFGRQDLAVLGDLLLQISGFALEGVVEQTSASSSDRFAALAK
jgi:hypothetical protein